MVDASLLARVDQRAAALGQTRRVFLERALERALEAKPEHMGVASESRSGGSRANDSSVAADAPVPASSDPTIIPGSRPMCHVCRSSGPPRNGRACPSCGSRREGHEERMSRLRSGGAV